MVDMKVTLYDGAFHEVDLSAIAFEIATRAAMKEGCEKAGVKLLEPIMDVEVVSPGEFVGGVIGDINSRRGQIRDQQMRGNATVIRAYRAARQHVRLHQYAALDVDRSRAVHDAVRALRGRAAQRRRRGQGEVRLMKFVEISGEIGRGPSKED